MLFPELRQASLEILALTDPQSKVAGLNQLFDQFNTDHTFLNTESVLDASTFCIPGRPIKPELVPPLEVPKRAMNTNQGRASLLHALAHIEFNAMNLALDAIWRFHGMPQSYYQDWLRVAKEEAFHFSLLDAYLNQLGYVYGDFPAHNSLWEMVERTSDAVIARMALVPRTMEARGLDAVPAIRNRFEQIKDARAVEILEVILKDEIGHVLIGNKWFNFLCQQEGLSAISTYKELARKYRAPVLKGPFNFEGRKQAGFTTEELNLLGIE